MARTTIAALMAREGWEFYPTGGGCSAYTPTPEKELHGWGKILITAKESPTAPESLSEPVCVAVYAEDVGMEEVILLNFPNLRAALCAIL